MNGPEESITTKEYGSLPRVDLHAFLKKAGAVTLVLSPGVPDNDIHRSMSDDDDCVVPCPSHPIQQDYSDLRDQMDAKDREVSELISMARDHMGREDIQEVMQPILEKYFDESALRGLEFAHDFPDQEEMLRLVSALADAIVHGDEQVSVELQNEVLECAVNNGSQTHELPDEWVERDLEEHALQTTERELETMYNQSVLERVVSVLPGGEEHGSFGATVFTTGWQSDYDAIERAADWVMREQGFAREFDPGNASWFVVPERIGRAASEEGNFNFHKGDCGGWLWDGSTWGSDVELLFADAYKCDAPEGFSQACEPLACILSDDGTPEYMFPRGVGSPMDGLPGITAKPLGPGRFGVIGFVRQRGWWYGPYMRKA